ncbi:amidohydrolase [[Clostridium] dakarense]|uniref:amidohydrolase n=1 Tax=Faecalimicrobium dakarense TaxID=1301100 RepID=UPI0004AE8B93|nr:amidohydrolase [[Clostridium] dakarense]
MIFIKNGTINTVTNGIIKGDILIEDGKIKEIGQNLEIPSDVETIDANGKQIFPGFIDAHTHLGLWEDGMGFEGADGNEETDPITPQLNPIDGINPMDKNFKEALQGGITAVCTTPGSANVMGGQCIAIKTFGRRIDNMVIKNPVASKIAFGENPKSCYGRDEKMPQTRMAIASLLRENLKKAEEYLDEIELYMEHEDHDKPEYDIRMESLIPVLKKEIPFKVHAHRADDIFTAIRIAKEFDVDITLDHCTEGHLIAEDLLEEGYPTIVGPSLSERSKIELRNLTFETAGILSNTGVNVSLTTDHPVIPVQYLPVCAGIAVKHGMKKDEAIKAMTINPAKTLGIDDKVGSIEVGKDADIVIWDGSPLEIQSNVLFTIINGKIVYKK